MSKVLNEYARQVAKGLQIKEGQDELSHAALGLVGEAGEVADLVKKSQYEGYPAVDRSKLFHELGDVLWYLQWIAERHGWTLEALAIGNIEKLELRRGSERYDVDAMLEAAA